MEALYNQLLSKQHPLLKKYKICEEKEEEEEDDESVSAFKQSLKEHLIKSFNFTSSTDPPVAVAAPWEEVVHPLLKLKSNNYDIYKRGSLLQPTQHVVELELISKQHEDAFLLSDNEKRSCSNGAECAGMLLPKYVFDWPKDEPGVLLPAFITPNKRQFPECLLCLRRKVTKAYLHNVAYDLPAKSCIQPYRNRVEDYPSSEFIYLSANEMYRGITDAFVYFSYSKYYFYRRGSIKQRGASISGGNLNISRVKR
jgi:hypothetical protein